MSPGRRFEQMVKRIFVIEPGLIKMTGHPIQYALAFQELSYSMGVEVHIIPNRNVDREVLARLPSSLPAISRTCFQFAPDGPITFYHDLCQLDESCSFTQDDLVIVTSCYTKEIEGISIFAHNKPSSCCPKIAMNFHQLFPPATVSSMLCTREYQEYWRGQLRSAFNLVRNVHTNIGFWTTVSEALNEDYRTVAGCEVGMLPFLFARPEHHYTFEVSKYQLPGKLKLAFLGDGRQEKGLLLFLNTIHNCFRPNGHLGFVIQNIDTRGYNMVELEALNALTFKTRLRPDTVIIEKPLLPEAFHNLISAVDVVVLPYHPKHYDKRASMLFAQAVMHQKPVVVSSGTWMAEEINRGNGSGVIFDFVVSCWDTTITNLGKAILELQSNIELYRLEARERSKHYQTFHTVERYLQTILDYYEQR